MVKVVFASMLTRNYFYRNQNIETTSLSVTFTKLKVLVWKVGPKF